MQTIADMWDEENAKNPVMDGVIIVLALFASFLIFLAVGYGCTASSDDSDSPEPQKESFITDPVDISVLAFPKQMVSDRLAEQKAKLEAANVQQPETTAQSPEMGEEVWDYSDSDSTWYDGSYSYYPTGGDYVSNFEFYGEGSDGTYLYSWYSEHVLPGENLYALNNNGRHVDDREFVCDGDGYIAVAMNGVPEQTIISTPWGEAKVYDHIRDNAPYDGHVDVYTSY